MGARTRVPNPQTTSVLVVTSPHAAPNGTGTEVGRQIGAVLETLRRSATEPRTKAAVTWVLAAASAAELAPDVQNLLAGAVTEHGDDIVLQGTYGIPELVLGDRELHFERKASELDTARALGIPRSAIRRLRAPVEPDPRRNHGDAGPARTTDAPQPHAGGRSDRDVVERPVILGYSSEPRTRGARPDTRLWIHDNGEFHSLRAIRLADEELRGARGRRRLKRTLRRGDPPILVVDAYDDRALENLRRLRDLFLPTRLSLPAERTAEVSPRATALRPLLSIPRTPLWHGQLLKLAAARPRSPDARIPGRVLRPFGEAPSALHRAEGGAGALSEERVVHASMYGAAEMVEGDLHVSFVAGSIRDISDGRHAATAESLVGTPARRTSRTPESEDADPGTVFCSTHTVPLRVAGAFSFEWDTVRGLTTRVIGEPEEGASPGQRLVLDTDYILMDSLPWLVLRSVLSYPREAYPSESSPRDPYPGRTTKQEGRGTECLAAPLPIPLAVGSGDEITIEAWRHDGSPVRPELGLSERQSGRDRRYIPVPAAGMSLTVGGRHVHIVFIDDGERITWEPVLEVTRRRDQLGIRLLPYGTFHPEPQGIERTSILFAISLQGTLPDVTELRKRTLRVLPAPSCIPAGPAGF